MPIKTTKKPLYPCQHSQLEVSWKQSDTKLLVKAFPDTHSYIIKFINTITEEPKQMHNWLTTGIMYLLPKSEDTKKHYSIFKTLGSETT